MIEKLYVYKCNVCKTIYQVEHDKFPLEGVNEICDNCNIGRLKLLKVITLGDNNGSNDSN